ncbi:MAG: ATP-binding cassette domain-containing protein [Thermoplasmatales archaeon]
MYSVETYNLTKIYSNGVKAVDKINLQINEGEIYGLLGPNGAGKTTTIKMLTTALKPTEGSAKVAGYDIVKESMKVRMNVGIVPQDLTADEDLTGMENLLMVSKFYNVPYGKAKENIDKLVKLVDLRDSINKLVGQYSGGMRRRLELIMGLVHNPRVLFLDEPTLGLDVQTRSLMWEYIRNIQQIENITIILTSHYLEEVDALSNRLSIINKGKIVVTGTPEELKKSIGGDIVVLTFKNGKETLQATDILMTYKASRITELSIKIKSSDFSKDSQTILGILKESNLEPLRIQVEKPSLDTVFLEYVGRSLPDEEGDSDSRKMMLMMRRLRK